MRTLIPILRNVTHRKELRTTLVVLFTWDLPSLSLVHLGLLRVIIWSVKVLKLARWLGCLVNCTLIRFLPTIVFFSLWFYHSSQFLRVFVILDISHQFIVVLSSFYFLAKFRCIGVNPLLFWKNGASSNSRWQHSPNVNIHLFLVEALIVFFIIFEFQELVIHCYLRVLEKLQQSFLLTRCACGCFDWVWVYCNC